jgi:hypothetical protein
MHAFNRLIALDAVLVKAGFPPLSQWWVDTFRRFYESGKRQLVVRKGRRAGGSSSLCRLAVVEALYSDHKVPPGDIGTVAFISANLTEAKSRLRTIAKILETLKIPFSKREEVITLKNRPVEFRVFAATIAGVSGFTGIMVVADEAAKWADKTTGSNPATEVLSSVRPTMATQPRAKIVLSSSPWSTLDAHYEAFERGDNDHQMVAHCTTWQGNPTISEEQTHRDEPDIRIWRREYSAQAQGASLGAFDHDAIERAFGEHPGERTDAAPVLICDPSSGRKDAWSYCLAHWSVGGRARATYRDGTPASLSDGTPVYEEGSIEVPSVLTFTAMDAAEGAFWATTDAEVIIDRIAALARKHGVRQIYSDQREELMLRSAFTKRGFRFTSLPWSNPSKVTAVELLRRWFATGGIALPQHEKLRRELEAFEEKILPSGALTFAGRGNGSDDFVALLITCAMASASGGIPSDPTRKRVFRGNLQRQILSF